MSRRLIILRHAHSSRDDLDLDDHDRPLDEIGLRDSPIVAREIIQRGWKPDHIFVSSSLRTLQTLENMGPQFSEIPKSIEGELYQASLPTLLSLADKIDEGRTEMIIGHNPGCEMLLESMTGNLEMLPTCSASLISMVGGKWILNDIIRP
jgi:phosphohistidine phosphatase